MILRRRRLSCRQVGRMVQAFLDGEITDTDQRRRLAEHLDECRRCGLEAETYRSLKLALAAHSPHTDVAPELVRLRTFGARLAAGEIDP